MNPAAIVDILLEQEDRADSDPAERPAFPRGLIATLGGETLKFLLRRTARGAEYRMTKLWPDDYSGKPRSFEGIYRRATTPEAMTQHFNAKAEQLRAAGWTVEVLGP